MGSPDNLLSGAPKATRSSPSGMTIPEVFVFQWQLLVRFAHPDNKLSGLPRGEIFRAG